MDQTNPEAGVPSGELSVEQRLANLYGAQVPTAEPEPAPEAVEAPQSEGQADELTADDIPDEGDPPAQPESAEFEIVHNGIQHKLDRAKTIELAQKGFDYTQKTQDLASKQKEVQAALQRAQELETLAPDITSELAQVKAAEKALEPWMKVNWIELATNDPLEYPKYRAQFDQLREAYGMARGSFERKLGEFQQKKTEVAKSVLAQEMAKLREYIPAFSDPQKFESASKQIKAYGLQDGYSPEELDAITDARMVRTLWKASQYDQLVKSKAEKVKQVRAAPPTAKPGAVGQTQSAEQQQTQKLRQSLKKSGDWRDAAALIARLK